MTVTAQMCDPSLLETLRGNTGPAAFHDTVGRSAGATAHPEKGGG